MLLEFIVDRKNHRVEEFCSFEAYAKISLLDEFGALLLDEGGAPAVVIATDYSWDLGYENTDRTTWKEVLHRLRADGKIAFDGFGEERSKSQYEEIASWLKDYTEKTRL